MSYSEQLRQPIYCIAENIHELVENPIFAEEIFMETLLVPPIL